jgi:hypothetical protein
MRHGRRQPKLHGVPAVFPACLRKTRVTVGTQQKLPFNGLQQLQKGVKVHPGVAVVMPLIRADIGRIKVKERLRRIPALDDPQCITALDLRFL